MPERNEHCLLTLDQISAFIPSTGITVEDLKRCFSTKIMPRTNWAEKQLRELIAEIAVINEGKCYLKAMTATTDKTCLNATNSTAWPDAVASLASGSGVGAISLFSTLNDTYYQNIQVTDRAGFRTRHVTLDEGAFKGVRAIVLENSHVPANFRLMDLPTEMRVMIYDYLVNEPDQISFTNYKSKKRPRRPIGAQMRALHKGKEWDVDQGKWLPHTTDMISPICALMQVSREVQSEVAPVVYARNTFHMDSLKTMHTFLETIGFSNRKFLRHISFSMGDNKRGENEKILPLAMALLRNAHDMRSLTLDHEDVCSKWTNGNQGLHAQMVDFISPFLQKMLDLEKRGRRLLAPGVMDLVRVSAPGEERCDFCKTDNGVTDDIRCKISFMCARRCTRPWHQHYAETQELVRKAIAWRLGLRKME